MGKVDQVPFDDDNIDVLDDFDDDASLDEPLDESLESKTGIDPEVQARINARHEIERRNELKALKSVLDEWDELLDEDEL